MTSTSSKILIVDNNASDLFLMETILKEVDAEILIAESGKEALVLINDNDFALVILDIQMPVMDGFELAGHIRNMKNRDLVPIIFMTAYFPNDIQMFKGYENGAIDYMTKPANKNVFISKVKIFLDLDQQKRNLIASKESLQKSKIELEVKQNELSLQNVALKIAQSETEESRKKYIKLYEFAPTGYLTINREGNIYEINHKGAKLLGSEPINLINQNFKDFICDEMFFDLDSFFNQIFNNEATSGYELKLKPSSQKTVFIYLEGAIIDEEQKCLLAMVDVTERKEVQIALMESEELYHSLLKTSPDGIVITDLNGNITEASDIAIKLLADKSVNKIAGLHLSNFVPQKSKRALLQIFRKTVNEGMVQNLEIKLNRIDGSEFTGEISSSQIKDTNGNLKAFMSDIRDISERKVFEKQLRDSERMAGIGELATGMAHEINQPLNTISLTIDNIIFSIENKTITENYLITKINKVFENISRIKQIIEHVRTFSQDQYEFAQSTFDLNKSIQNSISMTSEQMSQKGILLTFKPDTDLPKLNGNSYRFEQVILNLLVNAKDALEEKKKKTCTNYERKIEISTIKIENHIKVEVKDNGIGIRNEDIDKVLLPFFTTKASGKGTGLGLSISYGIIRELGGEIEVKSEPLQGTSIAIKIPINQNPNKKH